MSQITHEDMLKALDKYTKGDWGITCEEDWKANDEAIRTGDDRVVATYKATNNISFYIITEQDRSATTILLPEDY
jgi:hypothetical protein